MSQDGVTLSKAGMTVPEESVINSLAAPAESSVTVLDDSVVLITAPSTSITPTKPKTKEELCAARALKRSARKAAIREKAEGHKRAGDSLLEGKKYKPAQQQYLEATQLWPSNPDYFISLAGAYRKLQWYEEAAYAATQALTLDPKNSEARYVRGVARMEQRLLKPARIDFETVLKHDPKHLLARAALTEVKHFIRTSEHLGAHTVAPSPIEELTKDVDFGFPHHDQDALELASMSDSSDCNHVGNGVQCRFYNREGCARGNACVYSHAPDEKSVRDELGRNVCTYFLLGSCKFGAEKCIYSHSEEALPKRGWWSSPEKIEKAKAMMAVAEQKNREQRQLESERWKAYLKAVKAAGRPPKSAGVKGDKQDAHVEEEAKGDISAEAGNEEVNGDPAPVVESLESQQPIQKQTANGQKRKPQPKKMPAAKTAAATTATAPFTPAATDKIVPATTSSGFTDYKQDERPAVINPFATVVLELDY